MEGLIVILLYAFKLAFLALLACEKTKVFSLKSEVKKAYLHAHKRILIMPSIMKEVYCNGSGDCHGYGNGNGYGNGDGNRNVDGDGEGDGDDNS